MADEVDYGAVAEMTDGMVGAQLANILDVAALSVLRDSRPEVSSFSCWLEAAQTTCSQRVLTDGAQRSQ